METIAIMILGIGTGRFFPVKYKAINEKLQLCCTLLLIFSMGAGLGQREGFFRSCFFWECRVSCFF